MILMTTVVATIISVRIIFWDLKLQSQESSLRISGFGFRAEGFGTSAWVFRLQGLGLYDREAGRVHQMPLLPYRGKLQGLGFI